MLPEPSSVRSLHSVLYSSAKTWIGDRMSLLPRRRGCLWAIAASAVALVTTIGVVVHAVLTWDPRAPFVEDPRACPQSNVSLTEVAEHFGIMIPVDATELHFFSDLHPFFGEYSLQLSFRTTRSGGQAFLAAAELPKPKRPDDPSIADMFIDPDGPTCGFSLASLSNPLYSGDDISTSTKPFQRQVAMDGENIARPRVVLSALDL